MIKIMFVCYGNICRSTMAEFIMKDLVRRKGVADKFLIASSGTSREELGNPVHRGTRAVLSRMGISCSGKYAVQLKKSDYFDYDYFIGMDDMNRRDMLRIFGADVDGKISLLLDYTKEHRGVADPYWTGDFEQTKIDVINGVNGLFDYLIGEK